MGRLIDTSIFIDAERGRLNFDHFDESADSDEYFMSVITVSELLHGVHRASPKYRKQRAATVEKWIEEFTILNVDIGVAREHARIHSELQTAGQLIGVHDQWLAATCLAFGLTMVTSNVREFVRVKGLVVESLA